MKGTKFYKFFIMLLAVTLLVSDMNVGVVKAADSGYEGGVENVAVNPIDAKNSVYNVGQANKYAWKITLCKITYDDEEHPNPYFTNFWQGDEIKDGHPESVKFVFDQKDDVFNETSESMWALDKNAYTHIVNEGTASAEKLGATTKGYTVYLFNQGKYKKVTENNCIDFNDIFRIAYGEETYTSLSYPMNDIADYPVSSSSSSEVVKHAIEKITTVEQMNAIIALFGKKAQAVFDAEHTLLVFEPICEFRTANTSGLQNSVMLYSFRDVSRVLCKSNTGNIADDCCLYIHRSDFPNINKWDLVFQNNHYYYKTDGTKVDIRTLPTISTWYKMYRVWMQKIAGVKVTNSKVELDVDKPIYNSYSGFLICTVLFNATTTTTASTLNILYDGEKESDNHFETYVEISQTGDTKEQYWDASEDKWKEADKLWKRIGFPDDAVLDDYTLKTATAWLFDIKQKNVAMVDGLDTILDEIDSAKFEATWKKDKVKDHAKNFGSLLNLETLSYDGNEKIGSSKTASSVVRHIWKELCKADAERIAVALKASPTDD